ncbi:CRISPR-associated helicase/endonuclease Cas3 [Salinicoccus carnicancri]|uniref:CRISPR-associated helicase/endonuclease Cas3 n=1 Tax=Salinicoccus carnicancri TaxID=558170 RepID=UPI0002DEF98D|nr:CRISPR-associated helicase/endonuclease Cas3 [Salinicoccus carnicancri]
MEVTAHKNQDTGEKQRLSDHLLNVGVKAGENGSVINQRETLFLLGILHDLGKADRRFQKKINEKPKLKVKHSAAGAKFFNQFINDNYLAEREIAKDDLLLFAEYVDVMSYVILSHHGLFDVWNPHSDENQLSYRMEYDKRESNQTYYFEEDVVTFANAFFEQYDISLSDLINASFNEFKSLSNKLTPKDEVERHFYSGLKMRMYLSFLKNADITDTINAYEEVVKPLTNGDLEEKKENYIEEIEKVYEGFANPVSEINKIRTRLAAEAKERGTTDTPGIYQLNLPTGSGKTLISLRYGVHQMKHQDKDRLIYITPFLSVLEQNAEEIKHILKDKHITEHHSNIVGPEEEGENGIDDDQREKMLTQYLRDSWDSPVILSTMVQFFQTLFKEKSNNIRRFSSLANSVIILDEVQSLPIEVTHLFNLTMNFISQVMESIVVLCTATQPTYNSDYIKYQINYQIAEKKNIVKMDKGERSVFDRTTVSKLHDGESSDETEIVKEVLDYPEDSILIILNTKKAVKKVVDVLEERTSRPVYYLSTNLCPQHRKDIIKDIKRKLPTEPVVCVSTQLIEAGVDIDFKRLIRSYAGIDSIVQSMGRCNRNGKLEGLGQVKLVKTKKEFENMDVVALKSIKEKVSVTEKILRYEKDKINVEELNDKFYDYYYANSSESLNYSLGKDKSTAVSLLSKNIELSIRHKRRYLNQSFKSAGQIINLIDQETTAVIVYYKQSRNLIEKLIPMLERLETEYRFDEIGQIKIILDKLQPYTVNLYSTEKFGHAIMYYLEGRVSILIKDSYDEKFGIIEEAKDFVL